MDAQRLAKFKEGKSDAKGGYNTNEVARLLVNEGRIKTNEQVPRPLLIHILDGGKYPETREDRTRWGLYNKALDPPAPAAPVVAPAPAPVAAPVAAAAPVPVPLQGAALGAFLDDIGAEDVDYIDVDVDEDRPPPYKADSGDDEDIIPANFFEEPIIDAGYVAHEHAKKAARTHAKRRKLTEGEKLAFKRGQRSGVWLANHSDS